MAAPAWKRFGLFAVLAALPLLAGSRPELSQVKTVYLLPMSNGFDQYLANQLTMQDVLQVVTDPNKADAIFTSEIGERFERQLEVLYPPPPPAPKSKPGAVEKKASAGESGTEVQGADTGSTEPVSPKKEEAVKKEQPIHVSTFSRGRGNVFLVERASGNVIWSTYYRPKNFGSKQLNHSAGQVVKKLKAALAAH